MRSKSNESDRERAPETREARAVLLFPWLVPAAANEKKRGEQEQQRCSERVCPTERGGLPARRAEGLPPEECGVAIQTDCNGHFDSEKSLQFPEI